MRDLEAFPNRTTESAFFPSRARGYSAASFKYKVYSRVAENTFFYMRYIDLYTFYRTLHMKTASENTVRMNEESPANLVASPFKLRNLRNPWVLVPVAIAGASTYFLTDNDAPLSAARRVNAIDRDLSPNGSALYEGGIEIYRQMLVGAGEEMYFRGIIQTEMTEQLGPNVGLFLSSFLFGLWHVSKQRSW